MSDIAKQMKVIAYAGIIVCCALWLTYAGFVVYETLVPWDIVTIHSITFDDSVAVPGQEVSYTVRSSKYANVVPAISRCLICDDGRKYAISPDVTGTSPVGDNLQFRPSFSVPDGAHGVCNLYWQATYPPANRFQDSKTYRAVSDDTIEIVDKIPFRWGEE
jgi:hypothetical protein